MARAKARAFMGVRGRCPQWGIGRLGGFAPEADDMLTFCEQFSELNCTQIYCFMLLITI